MRTFVDGLGGNWPGMEDVEMSLGWFSCREIDIYWKGWQRKLEEIYGFCCWNDLELRLGSLNLSEIG
jgi:hypothetical protein